MGWEGFGVEEVGWDKCSTFVLFCFALFFSCVLGQEGRREAGRGAAPCCPVQHLRMGDGQSLDDTSETSPHVGSVPRVFLE